MNESEIKLCNLTKVEYCKYSSHTVILVKNVKDHTLVFVWKILAFPMKLAALYKNGSLGCGSPAQHQCFVEADTQDF